MHANMQYICCRLILNVSPLLFRGLVLSVVAPCYPRCTYSTVCAFVLVRLVGAAVAAPGMALNATVPGRHVGSVEAAICMNVLAIYSPHFTGGCPLAFTPFTAL